MYRNQTKFYRYKSIINIAVLIFMTTILAVECSPDIKLASSNQAQNQVVIMNNNQYHFILGGSFFQFSLADYQQAFDAKYLSQISIVYSIEILSKNSSFNFIVLQSQNNSSAQQFNCYVRAVNEGLTELMNLCSLNQNSYIASYGQCNQMIASSAMNTFQTTSIFKNCSDQSITYNISLQGDDVGTPFGGTLLFILDNSGLAFNGTTPPQKINFILSFQVVVQINQEDKAKLYLFCGLTGILIAIMIILALVLNCKIRKIDKQMEEKKQKQE